MKVLIKNARLIDPYSELDGVHQVAVAGSRIVEIDPTHFEADRIIDAKGLLLAPGLVDLSVRLKEPGNEHKASLEHEMQTVLAGGITRLVLPPDTDPVLDEPGLVEMLKQRAYRLNQAHVHPLGAMTINLKGQQITEMSELTDAGCVAFWQPQLPNLTVLNQCMKYASTFAYNLWLAPLEADLSGGVAASGAYATRLGLSGVPVQAETIALHSIFELQRSNQASVHLCRISSAQGIELVRQAKAEGLPVTCDVSINQLHFIDQDIGFFDSDYRLVPPLRSQRDRRAITQGLLDGTIDAICSDHTPIDEDRKMLPFAEAEPGAIGTELLLSAVYKWAQDNDIPLSLALSKITSGPAQVLRNGDAAMSDTGRLTVGAMADLILIDPTAHWEVSSKNLISESTHTPFRAYEMPAQVKMTMIGGRILWEA